jgi:hypothetical protein
LLFVPFSVLFRASISCFSHLNQLLLTSQSVASHISIRCFSHLSQLLLISRSVSPIMYHNFSDSSLYATSFTSLSCSSHLAQLLLPPCTVATPTLSGCFWSLTLLFGLFLSLASRTSLYLPFHIALCCFFSLSIYSILSQLFLISIFLPYRSSFTCFSQLLL